MKRIGVWGIVAFSCVLFSAAGCTGDDDFDPETGDDTPADASWPDSTQSSSSSSSGSAIHDGSTDSSADANSSDAADADTSTLVRTTGPSGRVIIDDIFVTAQFFAGSTIVRDTTAPGCFTMIREGNNAPVGAGAITLGGEIVGTEGGLTEESSFEADPETGEYFFDGNGSGIFPMGGGHTLTFALAGTEGFPPASISELPTPGDGDATFTSPVLGDGRTLRLRTDVDLTLTWTAPANSDGQSITLSFNDFLNTDTGTTASLYCSFSAGAGAGRVPAGLLAALREVAGSNGGFVEADIGGASFLGAADGAAYLVVTRRLTSTNWAAQATEPALVTATFE